MHERRRFTAAAAHGDSRTQMLTALMVSLLCVHALFLSFACYCALLPHVGPPGFFDLCIVDLYDSRVLDTHACSGGAFFARNGKFSLGATTIRRTKAYSGGMLAAVGLLEVRSELRRQRNGSLRPLLLPLPRGSSRPADGLLELIPVCCLAPPPIACCSPSFSPWTCSTSFPRTRRRRWPAAPSCCPAAAPCESTQPRGSTPRARMEVVRQKQRARRGEARATQRSTAQRSGLLMPFRGRRATRQSPSWGSLIFGLHRALRLASLRIFSVANLIFVFRRRRDLELLAAAASNSDSQPVVVHRHRRPQRRRRRSAAHRPSLTHSGARAVQLRVGRRGRR